MSRQFSTLIDISQSRSGDCARHLAAVMARLREAEAKLDTLESYRGEYRARQEAMIARGAPASDLNNFRGFLAKLEHAIAQQRHDVERWRQTVLTARQDWEQAERQVRSYSVIQTQRQQAQLQRQNRAEQKQQDEAAARGFFFGRPRLALIQ